MSALIRAKHRNRLTVLSKRPIFDKTLYGAAYYNEYHPIERLDADFRDMAEAQLTVLRVGESVWSLWEPEDGVFNLDWLAPILDNAFSQGIAIIIGTPTYAMPNWLRIKHPEIVADRKTGFPIPYGHRQNMDYSNSSFLKYADRIIEKIVTRYKDHPAVIGWQVDNEPGVELLHNLSVFEGFKRELKEKFGTVQVLNKTWGLVYWSHSINDWDELWVPDGNTNNGYDHEWRTYQARITERFISWQAEKVREIIPDNHFITTCIALDRPAQDIHTVAANLDITAVNVYYATQDGLIYPQDKVPNENEIPAPFWISTAGPNNVFRQADLAYSVKQDNFLVTETNASSTAHVNSAAIFPPYPGQLRQVVLGLISRGANMVEYWHWHTLHYGAETYCGGILGHNYQKARTYQSFKEIAGLLAQQKDLFQDLKPVSSVALLFSSESKWGLEFQPALRRSISGLNHGDPNTYERFFRSFYNMFFDSGLGVNIVGANQLTDVNQDVNEFISAHPVLCIPGYYIADDKVLDFAREYAQKGGHLVLGPRTGYATTNGTVRTSVSPGVLRKGAGVYYDEFTNLSKPANVLGVKGTGIEGTSFGWADLLISEGADVVANYDDPFLSTYAAVTSNKYGSGRISMVGTAPNQGLGKTIGDWISRELKYDSPIQTKSDSVTVSSALSRNGNKLNFIFNWSWDSVEVEVKKDSFDVETQKKIPSNSVVRLNSWGAKVLLEE
jgi:beta-galactosidase